ncbi:hypothetical protein K439DRAFT_147512 [Ramaria rubella]|nr:hypothetical protein K439DRAFT_147512 [Ramaria rubella]
MYVGLNLDNGHELGYRRGHRRGRRLCLCLVIVIVARPGVRGLFWDRAGIWNGRAPRASGWRRLCDIWWVCWMCCGMAFVGVCYGVVWRCAGWRDISVTSSSFWTASGPAYAHMHAMRKTPPMLPPICSLDSIDQGSP